MNTNASTATTTTTTITMMIHAVVLIRVPFCLADSGLGSRCTLSRNYPLDTRTRRGFIRNWARELRSLGATAESRRAGDSGGGGKHIGDGGPWLGRTRGGLATFAA